MKSMVKQSFVLGNEEMEIFRAKLERLGCISKRGPLAGKGSPQPFIDDFINDRWLLVENPDYKTNGSQSK